MSNRYQESYTSQSKNVLLVGRQLKLIHFAAPAYATFPGMDASKVPAGLDADVTALDSLGYIARLCVTDFDETAEQTVAAELEREHYDCVLIGAGARAIEKNSLLFEKLINAVHQHAPQAKICFNTKPTDSLAAVRRWIERP